MWIRDVWVPDKQILFFEGFLGEFIPLLEVSPSMKECYPAEGAARLLPGCSQALQSAIFHVACSPQVRDQVPKTHRGETRIDLLHRLAFWLKGLTKPWNGYDLQNAPIGSVLQCKAGVKLKCTQLGQNVYICQYYYTFSNLDSYGKDQLAIGFPAEYAYSQILQSPLIHKVIHQIVVILDPKNSQCISSGETPRRT